MYGMLWTAADLVHVFDSHIPIHPFMCRHIVFIGQCHGQPHTGTPVKTHHMLPPNPPATWTTALLISTTTATTTTTTAPMMTARNHRGMTDQHWWLGGWHSHPRWMAVLCLILPVQNENSTGDDVIHDVIADIIPDIIPDVIRNDIV